MEGLKPFGDFQLDVLKEIGNIGAGHAATALSSLLQRNIGINVPLVQLLPFDQVAEVIGGTEAVVATVFLRVEGDITGSMFFILTVESAKRLLQMVRMEKEDDGGSFSELEISALNEIGNILAGSYLTSLADFTRLQMRPTVPSFAIDMAGAILGSGLAVYGVLGDYALVIDTSFFQAGDEMKGHFFLVPDPDALERLFSTLGVPWE
ncbi:CheY-P phosphatase CheC [Bacillaceae bacterium]